ncbi:MAG: cytochrome c [Croceibacterium sp.]
MRKFTVSRVGRMLLVGSAPMLALAGCAMDHAQSGTAAQMSPPHMASQPQPGSATRTGAQTGLMAAQYNHPRAGTVAATGASAWVPPAPPPAFTVASLPPADPPPPPLAAVQNRQPAPVPAASAANAADIVRPEAAQPAPATATLSAATRAAGRKLFNDNSCSACHALADAGASGSVGPSLDNTTDLSRPYIIQTVKTGGGPMPAFAGILTEAQIGTLADYILGAHK